MKNPRSTNGFTLIELMIAMVLGLLLISGIITVFAGYKRSSDLNTAIANAQESARFALNTMAKDIRISGFQGCLGLNRGSPVLLGANLPTTDLHSTATMASIVGDGNSWAPAPPLGFKPENHDALPGTHALTLQFGSATTYNLAAPVSDGGVPDRNAPIVVDITPGNSQEDFNLSKGEFAIISNCTGSDIISISSISKTANTASIGHSSPENHTASLSFDYTDDASTKLMRFVSRVYYVGDTGLTNDQGDAITALYQQSLPYGNPSTNPPTELIRGIENMRISLGIRTDNNSLVYVQPDDALYDPTKIESVRIGLLMNSYDQIAQSNDINVYVLAGQPIPSGNNNAINAGAAHASDKRFRLAFNTTVKIRNRRN